MIDFDDIEALKQGDERTFHKLVDVYAEKVYNLCLSILQNQEDAEDCTQEIFTTVFLSINQFKGDSKLSTWIYKIGVNKCQELIRKRSRKKRFGFMTTLDKIENSSQTPFYHPGIELDNKERAAVLFQALHRLPENQRIAFTLHKIEGFSYEEVCHTMEVSLSSVESLIFRARQNLKQLLGDFYEKNER